ncbi:MAG: integrase, partial [Gaiellaceae bacterium]
MLVRTLYSSHVVTRLFDFFTVNSQWQRRLWNVGLPLSLQELDEAIEGRHEGALSAGSVKWLAESI